MEHTREYLRENLASHGRRLGGLPLPIETIIDLEQLGYIVDLRTGETYPPDADEPITAKEAAARLTVSLA